SKFSWTRPGGRRILAAGSALTVGGRPSMSFVFSADGHITEPRDLYVQNISPDLLKFGLHSEKEGDYIVTYAGSKVMNRVRLNSQPRLDKNGEQFSRANRLGASNLEVRMQDLDDQGI